MQKTLKRSKLFQRFFSLILFLLFRYIKKSLFLSTAEIFEEILKLYIWGSKVSKKVANKHSNKAKHGNKSSYIVRLKIHGQTNFNKYLCTVLCTKFIANNHLSDCKRHIYQKCMFELRIMVHFFHLLIYFELSFSCSKRVKFTLYWGRTDLPHLCNANYLNRNLPLKESAKEMFNYFNISFDLNVKEVIESYAELNKI